MNSYYQQQDSSSSSLGRKKSSPLRYSQNKQTQQVQLNQQQITYEEEEELYEIRRSKELAQYGYQRPLASAQPNRDTSPVEITLQGRVALTSIKATQNLKNSFILAPVQSQRVNDPQQQHQQQQILSSHQPQYQNLRTSSQQVEQQVVRTSSHLVEEQISRIQSDNQSLMRRFNLVIEEIKRVKQEKEGLYDRLNYATNENSELQAILREENNIDQVNKYMQDDLLYEQDRNYRLKVQIKELDLKRNELIAELRRLQDQFGETSSERQQISLALQSKLGQIQDLEREHYLSSEKVRAISMAIEDLKNELLLENTDKSELQRIISQLKSERNDLLQKLEHLTIKYDDCVREITSDRTDMEIHNKQHAKLITAKIIFQQLETIQKSRLQAGFLEFQQYCQFDNKCHNRLNRFAQTLEKIGHFRMRQGLRQWYSNALRPLSMKEQSRKIAAKTYSDYLKMKMFINWKKQYDRKIQSYDLKTKAVQQIWDLQYKDKQIEVKRAFLIWKQCLDLCKLRQNRVKKLIWKLYFNKLSQAMNIWVNHNQNINLQVRLNLLSSEFSQKQYLTILFHNFKYQVTENKRKRQNILFHCMKSWKDFLQYQKFMMGSNVVVLQFQKNCQSSILKSCFYALREHKEQEKLLKVSYILNEEELPLIDQLNQDNDDIEVQTKFKAKSRAVESVKKMMSKSLYGYFLHWKKINEDYKEKLRTTIKDRIIKAYMEQIRKAFTAWKTVNNQNLISSQQVIIDEIQQDSGALQNEVLDLKKEIEQKQEQKDCSQQKNVLKCVTSYQRRMKQLAIGRWRDCLTSTNLKEDGASTIIRRLRLRFLRQAFDLYQEGVKYQKKLTIEEERCALYIRTRDERLKRQVVNAWQIFIDNHKNAKKYWYRMFLKLDLGMKQIAVKKWRDYTQKNAEQELLSNQNEVISSIENLNHQIGELHQIETDQQTQIQNAKNQMSQQARRIIANAFARFYYVSETRGLEKWKEYVAFEKHKEKVFKKIIDHWKKYQFNHVRGCFQNWIVNSNIQIKKEQLKKEEMKLKDAELQLEIQDNAYIQEQQKLTEEIEQVKQLQNKYNTRLQKSVNLIINKVDNNDSMSYKRYILVKWREYVQRKVKFINCVQNAIQKSLWNQAFIQIREFTRQKDSDSNKQNILNRFRLKFWRRTCGNAFSNWKSGSFGMVTTNLEELQSETNQAIEDFQQKKALFKEVNQNRSAKIIQKNNLQNLFQSWKNVTQFLKLQNAKDEYFQQSNNTFQKKLALFKWQQRKNATKLARIRGQRLKEKVHQIRLRQYFYALKDQFNITKEFCQRISNLARIQDHQGLKISFIAISSYAKSKEFVQQTKKAHASKDIESILNSLIQRRKHLYWRDLRLRTLNSKKQQMIKSFTILRCIGNQVRHYFQKWKEVSNERTLQKEMHEEGPIRDQVFDAEVELKNLKNFMKDEGYDQNDVAKAISQQRGNQSQLILKSIRRMQHYNEELYTKPKMFDRWRQYVHLRKLFRYWLGFVDKRSEYIKSDLHNAFDNWKNYQANQEKALGKLSKNQLDSRILRNQKLLKLLQERVEEKDISISHLNDQRETLVETYIKGQKLAMSSWMNFRRRTLYQGLMKWNTIVKEIKNREMLIRLRRNLEIIENLKIKITKLEVDNETIAVENEELRQFSLDGYEIAKNVQALTGEREKLSVDLADKAQVIRKLLDENDKLTSRLRNAQEEASNLIKSTMKGSSGFKGSRQGGSSPLRQSFY